MMCMRLLSACSEVDVHPDPGKGIVTPADFPVCWAYSCEQRENTGLTAREWSRIRTLMQQGAKSPEQERKQIAEVIGLMERIVGPKTGTEHDRAGTVQGLPIRLQGQMDCVDEATNTSTYLGLLARDHLLIWHHLKSPAHRILPYGWPHTTAVIEENKTGKLFAVDSWFRENGKPAYVVPLHDWYLGWKP